MAAVCALAMDRGKRITDSQGEYEGRKNPKLAPGGAVNAWPGALATTEASGRNGCC